MKKSLIALSALITFSLNAQITKPYKEKALLDLKEKTMTYFVSPGGSNDKDFKDVINKYWTATKFDIIKPDEVKKNLNPTSIFFSDISNTLYDFNGVNKGVSSFGYQMWSPTQKMIENNKDSKPLEFKFYQQFYEIKMEGDYWYAGFFKNFLQQIQYYMKNLAEKGKTEDVADPSKIAELKNAILYVPNYVMNKASDDKTPAELFSKYPYKYQMISSEDLNKKIMAGENIYYLLTCIYGQNCKIINVVNSTTGQLVYSSYEIKPIYNYLRKKDIAVIANQAEKAGK